MWQLLQWLQWLRKRACIICNKRVGTLRSFSTSNSHGLETVTLNGGRCVHLEESLELALLVVAAIALVFAIIQSY